MRTRGARQTTRRAIAAMRPPCCDGKSAPQRYKTPGSRLARRRIRRMIHERYRTAALARAFEASASRSRNGAFVTRESSSSRAACATWSTARANASSFALEGLVKPLSFRTNCSEDARISSSVAGGAKLCSVLMLRHMRISFSAHPTAASRAFGGRGRRPSSRGRRSRRRAPSRARRRGRPGPAPRPARCGSPRRARRPRGDRPGAPR